MKPIHSGNLLVQTKIIKLSTHSRTMIHYTSQNTNYLNVYNNIQQ